VAPARLGAGRWGPKVPALDGGPQQAPLFCAWLAWSRYRVVIPTLDRTLPTLISCPEVTPRQIGASQAVAQVALQSPDLPQKAITEAALLPSFNGLHHADHRGISHSSSDPGRRAT